MWFVEIGYCDWVWIVLLIIMCEVAIKFVNRNVLVHFLSTINVEYSRNTVDKRGGVEKNLQRESVSRFIGIFLFSTEKKKKKKKTCRRRVVRA